MTDEMDNIESWALEVERLYGAWPLALEWPMFGTALAMAKRFEREREQHREAMADMALQHAARVARLRARIRQLEGER